MGQGWHQTSTKYTFFCGKGNDNHQLGTDFSHIISYEGRVC
jgi:hypothetical protein